MTLLDIVSWAAIFFLSISYWFQIYKIHVHKEVRDISLSYNILLALGFGTLIFTAIEENSLIFLVKQIATTVPVLIIIAQVLYHRRDSWHDPMMPKCVSCEKAYERRFDFCPYCGVPRNPKTSAR